MLQSEAKKQAKCPSGKRLSQQRTSRLKYERSGTQIALTLFAK